MSLDSCACVYMVYIYIYIYIYIWYIYGIYIYIYMVYIWYIYIYIYIRDIHHAIIGQISYIYIYIYIYIYVIVGNCSKCCWRVLSTHECRAKYSSKWLNEACIIPCNSEFRAYALVRFNLRQIQFTHSSGRSRLRSTKIFNDKIPWWMSNHKTGL